MEKIITIGRSCESPVEIPADRANVSGRHARITIYDSGVWMLEDLESANGTFVRDDNGVFNRVYKRQIDENTVIRLGGTGHGSFTFMAHRVNGGGDDYTYEFRQLKRMLKKQQEEEAMIESRNSRNMNIVKYTAPLAVGLSLVAGSICDLSPSHNLLLTRVATFAAPILVGVFFGIDKRGAQLLKQKRSRKIVCPKCGYPLSEFDVEQMRCSRCKAQ